VVKGLDVYPVGTLVAVVELLNSERPPEPLRIDTESMLRGSSSYTVDYKEVRGQMAAKRAIEVATAGGHNIILIGPPGSGKTMLARRIPTILPRLEFEEALECTKIH
jgi:magnesium chelatase family protein